MSISVVHLVRASNGIAPFEKFIRSYTHFRAGIKHDLLLIFKGFSSKIEPPEYKALLADLSYSSIFIKDRGFDIGAYFIAADVFKYEYYCFLNSYSIILDEGWLAKMYQYISQDNIGLAGATGSYESLYSDFKSMRRFSSLDAPLYRRIIMDSYLNRLRYLYYYPPFPNYHIRVNAFMIKNEILNRVKHKNMRSKMDTLKFESGKSSLTRQILKMKLEVLVVGKDGKAYKKEDWPKSNTFRQNNQENLLISDNQTERYSKANSDEKMYLSKFAWGKSGA